MEEKPKIKLSRTITRELSKKEKIHNKFVLLGCRLFYSIGTFFEAIAERSNDLGSNISNRRIHDTEWRNKVGDIPMRKDSVLDPNIFNHIISSEKTGSPMDIFGTKFKDDNIKLNIRNE